MESKTHLLILSTLLLLHSHPSIATCVRRNSIHMLHNLLPPPSSTPTQPISSSSSTTPPPSDSSSSSIPSSNPSSSSTTPSPPDSFISSIQDTDDLSASTHVSTSPASSEVQEDEKNPSSSQPSASNPSPVADAAIKDVCSKTDYADLCVTSVSSFQPGPGPINAAVVLQLAIKASMRHAQAALNEAKRHAANPNLPAFTAENMKVCQENYSSALENLQNAAKAATANDKGTVNSMLSAAMTDFTTCADGFMEMPGASPLSAFDMKLTNLASNCLAIATLMN
ncbi:cell wall integrity and stress response component 1-like [Magnolia sinica]|uniref:cell wall integrity and stress response component 1-like n=1 Tax=Magnolia sinica TaxID=86752 RepID=UPI0026588547|nr:cell wall integrity and stress response component 1-like [Magnolia sinica]